MKLEIICQSKVFSATTPSSWQCGYLAGCFLYIFNYLKVFVDSTSSLLFYSSFLPPYISPYLRGVGLGRKEEKKFIRLTY